jgi:cytochrome c peroxidase
VRVVPAKGRATIDLVEGRVSVEVTGLPEREPFDVWLVDNRSRPGHSVKPEAGDGMLRLGRLTPGDGRASFETRLDPETLSGFKLDLVAVVAAGETPATGGVLFGSPSLFQRLHHAELRGEGKAPAPLAAQFQFLVPGPAHAQESVDASVDLAELVARGERLFFEETFGGNGRTCGTCHPAENNFTIDAAFIATRPPRDPLFVAEFNPALKHLENPELMRRFGLILENVDGLEDPANKFVMRGVPHTLGMPVSLAQATNIPGGPAEMTGWSGDGSPGGTLRDFATGAVIQHFTRTLLRRPGIDFRLPTPAQLDAMEAFQLSLGRQEDLDLTTLVLRDPLAQAGQDIFQNGTSGGDPSLPGGRCAGCHSNAGALNPGGENRNFNTGVEDRPDVQALGLPRDGGFGTAPNPAGGFGDGRFNTVGLVEAADTPPFFHNNVVATLEEAIEHFNSDAFNSSRPLSGQIQLTPAQVDAVAAFLRIINAVENGRSASAYATVAARADTLRRAQRPLTLAMHEVGDAVRVLTEQHLQPDAVVKLHRARVALELARHAHLRVVRNALIHLAVRLLSEAREDMVESG